MSDRFFRGLGRRLLPYLAVLAVGLISTAAQTAAPEKAPPEKAPPEKAPPEKAPPEKTPAHTLGDPLQHDNWVRGASFNPNSKHVATGCADGNVRIWDVETGKLLRTFKCNYPIWSLTYSPSGDTILVGTGDNSTPGKEVGEAIQWDQANGKRIGSPLPTKGPIFNVGYDFNEKTKKLTLMTICTDGTVQRWDAATGDAIGKPHKYKESLWCGALSPDASLMVVSPLGKTANIWVPDGNGLDGTTLKHEFDVQGVNFSSNGKFFATAAGHAKDEAGIGNGGEVRVWDATSGKQVGPTIKHEHLMHEVVLSSDGDKVLAGGGDKTVELWDVNSGDRVGAPMKQPGAVLALALSPNGQYYIAGGTDKTAQLWEFHKPLK